MAGVTPGGLPADALAIAQAPPPAVDALSSLLRVTSAGSRRAPSGGAPDVLSQTAALLDSVNSLLAVVSPGMQLPATTSLRQVTDLMSVARLGGARSGTFTDVFAGSMGEVAEALAGAQGGSSTGAAGEPDATSGG